MLPRRVFAALFTLFLAVAASLAALLPGAGVPPAQAQRVPPGGAPPAGSGPVDLTGSVRVIEGDTIDTYVAGKWVGIGFLGVTVPMGNTPCGQQAIGRLYALTKGGLHVEEDPQITFDARKRRMYYAYTPDGQSVAEALMRAGVARPDGRGVESARLAAAEAEAKAARAGCLWGSGKPPGLPAPLPSADVAAPTLSAAESVAAAPAATTLAGGFVQDVMPPD